MRVEPGSGVSDGAAGRRPLTLTALAVVLFVESAFLAVTAGFLGRELLTETPTSYASAVAIVVLAILATVWVFLIARNTLRARPWIRSAALTWQILQLAVALGSFQGIFARTDVGWYLLVPAIVALALLFTRSVMSATARER